MRETHEKSPAHPLTPLTLMPFGNSELESQRDSIVQPRVATEELPWVNAPTITYPHGVASSHRFPANLNFRKALPLTRIFHSETGKTMANHCSAGFQTCVPCRFNHAFERVCAPIFIGFFATLSQMAMKYPGWQPVEIIASMAGPESDHEISGTNWLWLRTLQRARQTRRKNRGW